MKTVKLAVAALLAAHPLAAPSVALAQSEAGGLDYGNDDSEWANDGECDDPRFVGPGVSAFLVTDNIGLDASDCRNAVADGTAGPNPLFAEPASTEDIDYGDDESEYAFDGECDDIRFTGDYAASTIYIVDDIGHDASDCRAAVESGEARWQGATATPTRGIEF